jgi:hypothetical protein
VIHSRTTLDASLFAAFAMANLAGHHADDGWEFGEVRKAIRLALAPAARRWNDELDTAGLKTVIRRAGGALVMDVIPQLEPPPALVLRARPLNYLTGWQRASLGAMTGFDDLLRRFYREAPVASLWEGYVPAYEQQAVLFDAVRPVLDTIAGDFRDDASGDPLEVRLVPNLLDARGRGYSVSFDRETWLFFGPVGDAGHARQLATHEFLHRWIDPIAEQCAGETTEVDPIAFGQARFRIVAELYPELAIWVGETVVRAMTAWYVARGPEPGSFDLDAALEYQERIGFLGAREIVNRLRERPVGSIVRFVQEAVVLARDRAREASRPDWRPR